MFNSDRKIVPKSSRLFNFSKSSLYRPEGVCLKYFFGSKRKGFHRRVYRLNYNNRRTGKHKKQEMNSGVRKIVKDLRKVFKNGIHELSHKRNLLLSDIETNPGPSYVNCCNTVRGRFHQGEEKLFGINAGNQCAANSLVAVVFDTEVSCFLPGWESITMDSILRVGNNLYSYLHGFAAQDHLLLNELPNVLEIDSQSFDLSYGESVCGDVNMPESRECYFSLFEALSCVRVEYRACLLTIFCNTVAIFFEDNKLKLFDAHSRDICGNACDKGTSVLLEFSELEALICYLDRKSVV